jgi:peroxin-5
MLDALVLQDTEAAQEGRLQDSRGVTSQSLWETLRTTCHHLHRQDLAVYGENRDLPGTTLRKRLWRVYLLVLLGFQAAFQQ